MSDPSASESSPNPDPIPQKPEPANPEKDLQKRRLGGDGSPFKGWRMGKYYVMQLFYLVFFVPGFVNAWQAYKIVATGKGSAYGYNKLVYLYPVIPITAIATGLSFVVDSPSGYLILGVVWSLVLLTCILAAAEDISGRMVGLFAGCLILASGAWVLLEVTGTMNVNEGVWRAVEFFRPSYSPGLCSFIAVFILALFVYTIVKSRVHQLLAINGNRWSPSRLDTEANFDNENHRIYARTPDWLERMLFFCRDLVIVPILEARNMGPGELEERAVYTLPNVPAGRLIFEAIEFLSTGKEVEKTIQ